MTPILAAITSFTICFLMLPVIISFSLKKNIVDQPGSRKVHKKLTPSMGGIAIFMGFLIASLIWIDLDSWREMRIILIALVMIFFIGLRDDLLPLKPITKIMGQIMAALILIVVYDLRLKSLYGLAGIEDIPLWASYVITVFTIVVITNSFNLIDGLDGLAGTIGSLALLVLGIWFFLVGDLVFATLAFSMTGGVVAFLWFNWEPSKVFMGDTGAMVVGIFLAIAVIHFIGYNNALPGTYTFKIGAPVSLAFAVLIIPLADTMRIFILRILRKQSPFTADKNHIHHGLIRLGLSHSSTTILLSCIQLSFITLTVIFRDSKDNYLLVVVILLATSLSIALDWLIRHRPVNEAH
jgi:UDP-GlcNAc:undecaprenyl-phosphate/decaprenyl-phosphate GlcNAc-1-phosphate transferase